jgi:hypothetical protein
LGFPQMLSVVGETGADESVLRLQRVEGEWRAGQPASPTDSDSNTAMCLPLSVYWNVTSLDGGVRALPRCSTRCASG